MPIPESVSKGLEHEPKITDFEIIKELCSCSFGNVYLVNHKEQRENMQLKP